MSSRYILMLEMYPNLMAGEYAKWGQRTLNCTRRLLAAADAETDDEELRVRLLCSAFVFPSCILDALVGAEYSLHASGAGNGATVWDEIFGANGERLTEAMRLHDYKLMHPLILANYTLDGVGSLNSSVLPLLFHWGDVATASDNADIALKNFRQQLAEPPNAESITSRVFGMLTWPSTLVLLGRNLDAANFMEETQLGPARIESTWDELAEAYPMFVEKPTQEREAGDHATLSSQCVHALGTACWVLATGKNTANGFPNLMAGLPTAPQLTAGGVLNGQSNTLIFMGYCVTCFHAMAFERLGDAANALAFAAEALRTEPAAAGGCPLVWAHALAHGVRGRVLAACGDVTGAAAAFAAAVSSAGSQDYWLLELFAAKDALRWAAAGSEAQAAAQQQVDQTLAKLASSSRDGALKLASTRFDGWQPVVDNRGSATGVGADASRKMLRDELPPMKVSALELTSAQAVLRRECESLRFKDLRNRARAVGLTAKQLEKATDMEDPEEELICFLANQLQTAEATLLSELQGLKVSALRKRAATEGVGGEIIEEAEDSDDPKPAIIKLICDHRDHRIQRDQL